LRYHVLYLAAVSDIALDENAFTPLPLDIRRRLFSLGDRDIGDDATGAFFGKSQGNAPPDTHGAAGDNGNPVLQ
jgi:hypothetical protein